MQPSQGLTPRSSYSPIRASLSLLRFPRCCSRSRSTSGRSAFIAAMDPSVLAGRPGTDSRPCRACGRRVMAQRAAACLSVGPAAVFWSTTWIPAAICPNVWPTEEIIETS